ncbi:alanine racemase [Haloferula helveola]|uniref:alanine racemase n=1 Tax=Haloferula helveola TaxID=490095 RepID=UPI0030D0E864
MKKPQLIVDLEKATRNVSRIFDKFQRHGVAFRPHFKTHQCAAIGELFREMGVRSITVSSLDMATYFAGHGWDDITLAVPVNLGQVEEIDQLAQRIRLNVLVDSLETASALNDGLTVACPVWIKVDVGYGRVGIKWNDEARLLELAKLIESSALLEFCGLLTHSGHTYECRGREEVQVLFEEGRTRMLHLEETLQAHGTSARISMGDTPSASLAEAFDGVDEMRPGNFVFYDVVQSQIGSCSAEDIAVAIACPVIGKYEADLKVVVYGGSVHFSKDSVIIDGERVFGQLALPASDGWKPVPLTDARIVSCCQEVSKIHVSREVFDQIGLGQTVYILPAHSCLAAEIYPRYRTTDGQVLERFRLFT